MVTKESQTECEYMKIKRIISLLVGIASLALSPITWAGPEGAGGGFHGGGGFRGGGFSGGHVGGGVGSRGGGVGFGGARFSGSVPNFAGGGPRFSSFGSPSYRQPVLNGRSGRSVTPSMGVTRASNRQQNHFASPGGSPTQGSRSAVARPTDQRVLSADNHIFARHDGNWHRDWDRRHAHFHNGHFFVFIDGFWCGLDAGFYPWDYLPYYAYDYYPYDYYADDQPYDNTEAVYNGVPVADATVQAVQTQLTQLGYYTGSVDGIFGPATRDAVAKYQIANQLNVTGSLSPDTLQSLGLPQVTPS